MLLNTLRNLSTQPGNFHLAILGKFFHQSLRIINGNDSSGEKEGGIFQQEGAYCNLVFYHSPQKGIIVTKQLIHLRGSLAVGEDGLIWVCLKTGNRNAMIYHYFPDWNGNFQTNCRCENISDSHVRFCDQAWRVLKLEMWVVQARRDGRSGWEMLGTMVITYNPVG